MRATPRPPARPPARPLRRPRRRAPPTPRAAPPSDDPLAALAALEVSLAAHEDVLLFLLGQDCDVALTRALAVDAFDAAAAARERRRRIDDALAELKAARVAAGDGEEAGEGAAGDDGGGVDAALRGVRLRAELADAIAAEDYAAAAALRDALKDVEAAAAAAAARDAVRAERSAPPALRLGQRVTHKEVGYRGVVCGYDPACLETPAWQAAADTAAAGGPWQPFYSVLVDARDWPPRGAPLDPAAPPPPPLTYVPQSKLHAPTPEANRAQGQGFDHPYAYLLFLGTDENGDLIPTAALRDRYGAPRVDVFPDGWDESDDGGDNAGAGPD